MTFYAVSTVLYKRARSCLSGCPAPSLRALFLGVALGELWESKGPPPTPCPGKWGRIRDYQGQMMVNNLLRGGIGGGTLDKFPWNTTVGVGSLFLKPEVRATLNREKWNEMNELKPGFGLLETLHVYSIHPSSEKYALQLACLLIFVANCPV